MARPLSSMTGFARAEGRLSAPTPASWAWEIRSVNNKGLDVRLRLPPGHDSLDLPCRQLTAEAVTRGSVSLNLTLSVDGGEADVAVNEALLDRLIALAARKGRDLPAGISPARLDGLMALKGVIETGSSVLSNDDVAARDRALLAGLRTALDGAVAARRQEGERLRPVILAQLDEIAALVAAAAANTSAQPEAIRARLARQVEDLLGATPALSAERLHQEAALLAVKGDIREEIDRLSAHVAQARELIAAGGPCGRRLDFLSQEFNREANTLCSKSQDTALTTVGLSLKAAIDQFREQIQNIE
ncbi:MAG: YicC/YloC family endoribonuclease [Rhodospirillaceae bacterium]|nr:YicC/YloC family endoribonuclease [Rhodospirillaceae bacterium]